MPSLSKSQQRLMAWAKSCKNDQSARCPRYIQKIGDSMSNKDLDDYINTKLTGLPEQVPKTNESLRFSTKKVSPGLYKLFKDWLDNKNIEWIDDPEDDELEIFNEYDLNRRDQQELFNYIDKLRLKKLWENGGVDETELSTLDNTVGVKSINPPGPDQAIIGSGDRFDQSLPAPYKKKKKKDEQKKSDRFNNRIFVKSFKNYKK